jgi:hypothetical protein
MYADDTALLFSAEDKTTLKEIAVNMMKKTTSWFERNRLVLNAKKTELLNIGPKNDILVSVLGEIIQAKEEVKYLGVVIDKKLSWSSHVKKVLTKANGALVAIKAVVGNLTMSARICLVNTLVISLIRYCCTVWYPMLSQMNTGTVSKIVKTEIRIAYRRNQLTHAEPLLKKAGILSVRDMVTYHQCMFIKNIINTSTPYCLRQKNFTRESRTRSHGTLETSSHPKSTLKKAINAFNDLNGKIETISKSNVKNYLISQYYETCTVSNCLVCCSNLSQN